MIGIDVVDIEHCGGPTYQHIHYLKRIASPAEQAWVTRQARPDIALWTLWAAKEATYKALCPLQTEEPFSPAEISISWEPHNRTANGRWRERSARIQAHGDQHYAGAVAMDEACTASSHYEFSPLARTGLLTPPEESQAAGHLAARLVRRLGYPYPEIARAVNGKPWLPGLNQVSVSLSHHGYWIAAAVAVKSHRGHGE